MIKINNQFKYVSRIDKGGQRTWFVRVPKMPGKSFCDAKHGGCMQALSAAIFWRDEQLGDKKDKLLSTHQKRFHTKPFKSNRSTGILGVGIGIKNIGGKSYYNYVAYSGVYPDVKKRNFSWSKYGRAEAMALAIQFRWDCEIERRLRVGYRKGGDVNEKKQKEA